MYSWEIENKMNERVVEGGDKVISSELYMEICSGSPQISRVKHNPVTGRFEIWTNDGYYFNFKVVKSEYKNCRG